MRRYQPAVMTVFAAFSLSTAASAMDVRFEDVTEQAGVSYVGENWAVAWGDFNGDGLPDFWLNKHGAGPASLYRNDGDGTFSDVAEGAGLVLPAFPDPHGATWVDFDNDGDQDLLQLDDGGSDARNRNLLFRNRGDQSFEEVAVDLGLDLPLGHGRMPLWLDADNDGRLDLLHTSSDRADDLVSYVRLFRATASGGFEDATAPAGVGAAVANFATLADVDGDGRADLLVDSDGEFPRLLLGLGGFPLADLRGGLDVPASAVLDAAVQDLNGDLVADAFLVRGNKPDGVLQLDDDSVVASLFTNNTNQGFDVITDGTMTLLVKPFFQFANNGIFVHVGEADETYPQADHLALQPGDAAGMPDFEGGVDSGVFIGYEDGRWKLRFSDLAFTARIGADFTTPVEGLEFFNFAPPAEAPDLLFLGTATGWVDATEAAGIPAPTQGASVVAADFDNDMDLDIYVASRGALANEPNILLENDGDAGFSVVPDAAGAAGVRKGRPTGVTVADYDVDGFVDILVSNGYPTVPDTDDGPSELFRNLGNANHWLEIDLVGVHSNRDGVGALVYLTAGGVSQMRIQNSGAHYRGQNHQRLHFGLGPNAVSESMVVQWPSGVRQVFGDEVVDQVVAIVETPGGPEGCPSSVDLDSDDDGLSDAREDANLNGQVDPGETDPCNADTDSDGLLDGTELGVTLPVNDPDGAGRFEGTDELIFVADLDPGTQTDPTDADTDDDGLLDGEEDANGNGRVDDGESDPNPPRSIPALPWWGLCCLAILIGWATRRSRTLSA